MARHRDSHRYFRRSRRRSMMEIPPPEQRLCKKHGKPIQPSRWKYGRRTSGCTTCTNKEIRGPKARRRRAERWEKNFIPCVNHPTRRSNRCLYVYGGKRRCSTCHTYRKDGTMRPARVRRNAPMAQQSWRRLRRLEEENGKRPIELLRGS